MLNVRLDEASVERLKAYSEQMNTTKSSIVKEALAMYFSNKESKSYPFALGKDLFGTEGSGDTNASSNYKARLKQKLREKHTH